MTHSEGPNGGSDGKEEHVNVMDKVVVDKGESEITQKKKNKRKRRGWGNSRKGVGKSRGQVDHQRQQKLQAQIDQINRACEEYDNPYDDMDMDTKKAHAIFFYNKKMSQVLSSSDTAFHSKSMSVKKKVAKLVGVGPKTVGKWVLEAWSQDELAKSKRGKHSKCLSPKGRFRELQLQVAIVVLPVLPFQKRRTIIFLQF